MSKEMKIYILFVVIFSVIYFAYLTLASSQCDEKGGRLVQGAMFYECVKVVN